MVGITEHGLSTANHFTLCQHPKILPISLFREHVTGTVTRGADPGGDKGYTSPSHFRVGGTPCDGVPPTFPGNFHA